MAKPKKEHRYKVAYRIYHQPDGKTKEFLKENDFGGCDDLMVTSIVYDAEGNSSTAFLSMSGENGKPLEDDKRFKAWLLLAKDLSESKTLEPATKKLCHDVFEAVRKAILSVKKGALPS